jgi:hypothetical protein
MDAEHLTSLRQAATALISTAAAPVVLAALRTLLADPEFAWDVDDTPPLRPPPSPRPQPSPTCSPEWDDLRQRVREAKAARGVTNQMLAEQIGLAFSTLDTAISARRPPGRAMMQRLEDWLDKKPAAAPVPEVTAYGPTFRGNGTSGIHSTYTDLSAAD